MVVGIGHINSALHPFFIFPAVELARLVLGSGIRSHSGLPDIFEFPCRRTGIVARLRGSILDRDAGRVSGDLLALGMFLFEGYGQGNQDLVLIGTLLVPLTGRLVFSIQFDHVGDEGTGVESRGIFNPLAVLALDVGKEIPSNFSQIVEG